MRTMPVANVEFDKQYVPNKMATQTKAGDPSE